MANGGRKCKTTHTVTPETDTLLFNNNGGLYTFISYGQNRIVGIGTEE